MTPAQITRIALRGLDLSSAEKEKKLAEYRARNPETAAIIESQMDQLVLIRAQWIFFKEQDVDRDVLSYLEKGGAAESEALAA